MLKLKIKATETKGKLLSKIHLKRMGFFLTKCDEK